MSEDPTADRPEGVAGVLGVGFLLLLVGVGSGWAFLQKAKTLEPAQVYAGWFEAGPAPFGFELDSAAVQPAGETLLRLFDPAAPAEAERLPAPPKSDKPVQGPPFDWSAIAIGPQNSRPIEALFATWPLPAARQQLKSLFSTFSGGGDMNLSEQSRARDPLAGIGPEGGRRVLESGSVPWGPFEAPFVHERKFEPGGTFVDCVRVNLSSEHEALVLFLRWPRGLPASTALTEDFLAGLKRAGAGD